MVTTTPLSDSGRSGACSNRHSGADVKLISDTLCCSPPRGSCKGRYQMVTTTPLSDSGRSGACSSEQAQQHYVSYTRTILLQPRQWQLQGQIQMGTTRHFVAAHAATVTRDSTRCSLKPTAAVKCGGSRGCSRRQEEQESLLRHICPPNSSAGGRQQTVTATQQFDAPQLLPSEDCVTTQHQSSADVIHRTWKNRARPKSATLTMPASGPSPITSTLDGCRRQKPYTQQAGVNTTGSAMGWHSWLHPSAATSLRALTHHQHVGRLQQTAPRQQQSTPGRCQHHCMKILSPSPTTLDSCKAHP
jgi:hypothetical protein